MRPTPARTCASSRRSRTTTTSSACRPTSSCPRKSSPRRPRGEPFGRGGRPGRAQHPMIVLGIDPGTAATGYGIVERNGSHLRMLEFGVLETLAGGTAGERLVAIHAGATRRDHATRTDAAAATAAGCDDKRRASEHLAWGGGREGGGEAVGDVRGVQRVPRSRGPDGRWSAHLRDADTGGASTGVAPA